MLPVIAIQLYHLREISLSNEHLLNTATIEQEAVSRTLEAVLFCDGLTQIGVRSLAVASPNCVCRDQLRLCIHRDEHPSVPKFVGVFDFHIALPFSDEWPDFVGLHGLAAEIAHSRIHECYAPLAGKH
jgi:hypothetical protein